MDYLTHEGITYETTIVALAREAGFSVELADMSSNGGLIAEAIVRANVITLVHQAPMPVEVYSWWAAEVIRMAELPAVEDEGRE